MEKVRRHGNPLCRMKIEISRKERFFERAGIGDSFFHTEPGGFFGRVYGKAARFKESRENIEKEHSEREKAGDFFAPRPALPAACMARRTMGNDIRPYFGKP
ncbi:MAG TPA: hypothetical protein PKY19_02485 [Oscillospiraceae bacterium]|nr:hypothetical protein [Oscillospiraceae bacterium]HXK77334.1 hypothetical protein [Oscillospiraceae bacterium]